MKFKIKEVMPDILSFNVHTRNLYKEQNSFEIKNLEQGGLYEVFDIIKISYICFCYNFFSEQHCMLRM